MNYFIQTLVLFLFPSFYGKKTKHPPPPPSKTWTLQNLEIYKKGHTLKIFQIFMPERI